MTYVACFASLFNFIFRELENNVYNFRVGTKKRAKSSKPKVEKRTRPDLEDRLQRLEATENKEESEEEEENKGITRGPSILEFWN